MVRACLALGAVLGLAGCGSGPDADPIAWWRQLEGGRLAEARPRPPNADAPYPSLATVPSRPVATEAATRARIAAGLETDRRDAAHAAAQPIVPPAGRRIEAPAPLPDGMGASLGAASAPAPPPSAVASPAPAAMPAPTPAAPAAAAPAAAAPVAAAPATAAPAAPPFPGLPAGPPPPPRLPGVAAVTAPTPALRAPPPAPPPPAPFVPGEPARIGFQPGSAILPEGAADTLRRLAASRAGRDLVVVGHGESAGSDAASQAGALPLAFARARAMAAVLGQAGVGPGAIRLSAEAIGRGGVARVAE